MQNSNIYMSLNKHLPRIEDAVLVEGFFDGFMVSSVGRNQFLSFSKAVLEASRSHGDLSLRASIRYSIALLSPISPNV